MKNLLGHRSHFLTVFGRGPKNEGTNSKHALWFVRCDCGREKLLPANEAQRAKTCGHSECSYYRSLVFNHSLFVVLGKQFTKRWCRVKESARERGLKVEITSKRAKFLFSQPCEYCGRTTNRLGGLDRVDSALDYTEDNIVPSCRQCNVAKLDFSKEEFIEMCHLVSRRHPKAY